MVGVNIAPTVPFDIVGNAKIDGNLTLLDELIVNEDGNDVDSRIESNNNANMLFVDAGNDRVGVGTGTPGTDFDVNGFIRTLGYKRTTSTFTKDNTTLSDITGLSVSVSAGKVYVFTAKLFVDADASGGHKYAIAGTCTASSITYQVNSWYNDTTTYVKGERIAALGGAVGVASGTTCYTEIVGLINVANAGTLTVQFALNAAFNTSSIAGNSHFIVEELA